MSRARKYKRHSPEFKRAALKRASEEGQGIISSEGTVNLAEGRSLESLWAKNEILL